MPIPANINQVGLIAWWDLNDAIGSTTAANQSNVGAALNGTATNVTFGVNGADKYSAGRFNGTSSRINIYSTSLNTRFKGNEGTVAAWAKVSGAGVWTDGTSRNVFRLAADGNNGIFIFRPGGANNTLRFYRIATGTAKSVDYTSTSTSYLFVAITWSKSADQQIAYVNGAQVGTIQTGLANFAGSLGASNCVIGAQNTAPSNIWSGDIQDVSVWDNALSAAQIEDLYYAQRTPAIPTVIEGCPTYELHSITTADGEVYRLNRDFMQGKGRLVLNPSPANWGMPPVEYQRTKFYKGDGEVEIAFRLGMRNFELLMQDTGLDRKHWLTIRQALINACRPNRGGFLTYTFELSTGETRSIQGRALIPFQAVDDDVFDDWSFKDNVAFECPDPAWYDTAESTCTATRQTADSLIFPITFPITFGDSDRYGACSIDYSTGSWYVYPIIEVTGPFSRLTINHEEKGIAIFFIKQLFAGQTVTFDLRQYYDATTGNPVGPTITDSVGNDYFGYLDKASNLVDFRLEPASVVTPAGINTISFDAPGFVDGQTNFVIRYQIRYIGI